MYSVLGFVLLEELSVTMASVGSFGTVGSFAMVGGLWSSTLDLRAFFSGVAKDDPSFRC